jgi:hypothetical protein
MTNATHANARAVGKYCFMRQIFILRAHLEKFVSFWQGQLMIASGQPVPADGHRRHFSRWGNGE